MAEKLMVNGPTAPHHRAKSLVRAYAPQDRGQSRHQFARQEGFAQIVIGPHFQPQNPVHRIAPRGQHDDGRRVSIRAQATANRQAILARQHQVQHNDIGRIAHQRRVQRLAAVNRADVEPMLAQKAQKQSAQFGIIIYDDNAGGSFGHVRPF
jgi:hypothetical protein